MGKKGKSTTTSSSGHGGLGKKILPFVSVCTPTFNRRPFIETMFQCFRNQTYPKHRMEWIIVDDGTDKINDLVAKAKIPQIKYFALDEGVKLSLGAKRNYMHDKTRGSILVYMDDDDYYPPDRVEHAVERLTSHPHALCSGSSEIYVYFKHIQKMIQCGPYGPNHATAGTFAFKRELLSQSRYEDHAALAEEKAFLKNYTIPFVQLDPMKSILVFSHEHNTFDKRRLLENPDPRVLKESPKTVDDFIRKPFESEIKNFFMNQIDALLLNYEPGEPKMKPDVLKQMKEIEEERKQMHLQHQQQQQQQQQQQMTPIMIETPGQPPRPMSIQEVAQVMQQQQQQLKDFQELVQKMQAQLQLFEQRDQEHVRMLRQLQPDTTPV
jgi:glycosyltransferase involved in cell wall biosynthesis